jgi:1,4-dihydroxy-2-naphthoate octaprenyltransferase
VIPALIVSLALQVGVNYANDYSDGVKGTDDVRVGPLRLVASGTKSAKSVLRAALLSFVVAAVFGLVIAATTSWWLVVVGFAAIVAAWTYTGGPRPYGYAGFGELFVFLFFGVVATTGTTYAVCESITPTSWIASIAAGRFACALLVVNNLRDIPTDSQVGKNTLAVRMGDRLTRAFFTLLFVVAAAMVCVLSQAAGFWSLLGLLGVAAAVPAVARVRGGARGADLIGVLGIVGRSQMIFGISVAVGIALSLK